MENNSEEHRSINSSEDLHMIGVDDMVIVSMQLGANKQKDKEAANDKGNEKNTNKTNGKATKKKEKETEKQDLRQSSEVWEHFTKFVDDKGLVKATCMHCKRVLCASSRNNGTSTMKNHIKICKLNPQSLKNQKLLGLGRFYSVDDGEGHEVTKLTTWKFDPNAVKRALVEMIIIDEYPFSIVERLGFKKFITVAFPPNFKLPSRRTVTKHCYDMYVDERVVLRNYFKESKQRVSLTTDTWTSLQKISFMSLTAHYIDENWKLHKKILNFCPVDSHKGEDLGDLIQSCLMDWGIDRVYTITVDNASADDGVVRVVRDAINKWGTSILGGDELDMRCAAHIINLVVQDGAKTMNTSINSVRAAVKFIRQSPQRILRFKEAAVIEKVDNSKLLSMETPTRWNSLYLMLETTEKYEMAFERYSRMDPTMRLELNSGPNAPNFPSCIDWENIRKLVKFLKPFYFLTERVSRTLYTTSNLYFPEICEVDSILQEWLDDVDLSSMARNMKLKYDKYWGDPLKMNKNIFIAVVLDPRHKLGFVQFLLVRMFGEIQGERYGKMVKTECFKLFEAYKRMHYSDKNFERGQCSTQQSKEILSSSTREESESSKKRRTYLISEYAKYLEGIEGSAEKSELERYLAKEIETFDEEFDVLKCWKVHSPRFPIIAIMARDVLAVPISTVASEAAFSTRGRVLDEFRSSLTPRMVQALICSQDWLKSKAKQASDIEDEDELGRLEKEFEKLKFDASVI